MSIVATNTHSAGKADISSLPKEIQDLIGEYNIEHRPQMKNVFKEIRLAKQATLLPFIDYEGCMNDECESIDAIREDPVREKRCGYWVTFCSFECSSYCARMVHREHSRRNWDTRYRVMIQEVFEDEYR